ncbi:DNA-binding response regulator [Halioxenophilus aromaticivorans]|uniref:Response regulator n=1 Tax=Halioxenophilus aromaticivorans TaxID=1306992 RepID=A0AAV3U611_9ALTE
MGIESFSKTVLVIDDAPDSLSLINDTLEHAGINTLVALDGKQGLTIANRFKPDLILLDAIMPNMDGFETCKNLKSSPELASIPIIFMTGLSDTDSVVKGLAMGGVDYLTKPVHAEELLARIRVHLKMAQLTSDAHQVLDSVGQHIATVDSSGTILWATPETHALLARALGISLPANERLVAHLSQWLASKPKPQSYSDLLGEGFPLKIILIEARGPDQWLLKFSDATEIPGEVVLQRTLNLTHRESEVLYWLACGKANKEISEILDISVRTVNKHLEQIFPKLGVENRTAAAGIAIRALNQS